MEKIRRSINRTVGVLTAFVIGSMILLALSQLIARWAFNSSITGADLMLRQMVLIIGLLGGVLAAASDRHIRIDLVDNFLKDKWKGIVRKSVNLTASVVAGFLSWTSISFVQSERQAEIVLRGLFFGYSIAQWYLEIMIPICFSLMAILFFISVFAEGVAVDKFGKNN